MTRRDSQIVLRIATGEPVTGSGRDTDAAGSPLGRDGGYFAMSFGPSASTVNLIRRFAEEFFAQVFGQSDAASRVGLATHELLENAVRYCAPPEIAIRGSVTPSTHGCYVTVRTRNRCTLANAEAAQASIRELATLADAQSHYQAHLVAQFGREGGLGLARLRAEAEMALSCELVDDELTVVASASFVTPRSSTIATS